MNQGDSRLVYVAFFTRCLSKNGGQNLRLEQILDAIKNGNWSREISELRRVPYKSAAYDEKKKRLPGFMLSASSRNGGHKGTDTENHTGLLQIDVDNLSETEGIGLRDRFAADPHVFAAWLSPSGCGVKAALCIPASFESHRRSFATAQGYFSATYEVEIDKKCSDPSRLCFVSHDPELKINEDSIPLPLMPEAVPTTVGGFKKHWVEPPCNSSESLSPESDSYILHNNLKFFEDYPGLFPFYDRHVRQLLDKPQRGHRNKALVELVASTFCVVCPLLVRQFAKLFYVENLDIFHDYPRDDYEKQVENILTGCLRDYSTKSLEPREAALYAQLPDETAQTVFRICRSLAYNESDPTMPPPHFYLSAVNLGNRLDELTMTAYRVLQRLEKNWGAIQITEKGQKRTGGCKALATKWKWCLNS